MTDSRVGTDLFDQLASGVLDDGAIDLVSPSDDPMLTDGAALGSSDNFPEAVRLYALRLWTFDAGRNPRKVSDLLKERAEIDVSPAIIRRWVLRDNWAEAAGRLHQSFSDASAGATRHGLSSLMPVAVDALRDILADPEASATARVRAAALVLGIGGYVPAMTGHTVNLAVNVGRDRLADMSDEELAAAAAAYRPDTDHAPAPEITEAEYRLARRHDLASDRRMSNHID
jgi:hypothetical protein